VRHYIAESIGIAKKKIDQASGLSASPVSNEVPSIVHAGYSTNDLRHLPLSPEMGSRRHCPLKILIFLAHPF
jgi:hypothetical protein